MLIRPSVAINRWIASHSYKAGLQAIESNIPTALYCCRRSFSESSKSSEIKQGTRRDFPVGERISKKHKLPLFRVRSEQVRLIEHPQTFYDSLIELIRHAKNRIFLASLYIGKSEYGLIDEIVKTLQQNSSVRVTILVDGLRSTREGAYEHNRPESESCASLLAGLQARFPDQVEIRAFRAPDLPVWLEKLVGKRFVEGWGLQHMKVYGADNQVMISGANLSNDYFTNRRDRYIVLKDAMISDYMYELVMTASRYSFSLKSTNQGNRHAPYQLNWDEGEGLDLKIDTKPTGPNVWKRRFGNQIEKMTSIWNQKMISNTKSKQNSVDIIPVIQMGPMNIQQETTCVPEILSIANEQDGCRLDFTTGYFSLNPQYAEWILNGRFESDMITASPQANGFYGSKGVSRHLPAAYTWLTERFWNKVIEKKRQDDVKINEWNKKGWTYHAKGIWLYPSSSEKPTLTLLGSSNFGIRSAKLDLECTLLIDAWNSPKLQSRLKEEIEELKKDATDLVGKEMFIRSERKVHWGVKVAAWCIRRML